MSKNEKVLKITSIDIIDSHFLSKKKNNRLVEQCSVMMAILLFI